MNNLTMSLVEDLICHIEEVLPALDSHGFQSVKKTNRFRDLVGQVMKAQHKAACEVTPLGGRATIQRKDKS